MGGIIGGTLGVLGGLLGTYFSIKNTKSRRERVLVIWFALAIWLLVGAVTVSVPLFPRAILWVMIPYPIVLTFGILFFNKKQMALRRSEQSPSSNG